MAEGVSSVQNMKPVEGFNFMNLGYTNKIQLIDFNAKVLTDEN